MAIWLKAILAIAFLIVATVAVTGCGGSPAGATEPSGCSDTGLPFCMSLVSGSATATFNPIIGFWTYSGTMVFAFSPQPPAGTNITLCFNDCGMDARGTVSGSQVTFTVGNSSATCEFVNPTNVFAFFNGNTSTTEATDTIEWNTPGCPQSPALAFTTESRQVSAGETQLKHEPISDQY